MKNDIYIIRHHNNIRTTSGTTSGTTSIYDSLPLILSINTHNTLSLPEKDFRDVIISFSFENVLVSASSLGGNCQASGELSVISSLGPLADTPLPYRIHSGLFINALRLTGPANWKHIVIKTNIKH